MRRKSVRYYRQKIRVQKDSSYKRKLLYCDGFDPEFPRRFLRRVNDASSLNRHYDRLKGFLKIVGFMIWFPRKFVVVSPVRDSLHVKIILLLMFPFNKNARSLGLETLILSLVQYNCQDRRVRNISIFIKTGSKKGFHRKAIRAVHFPKK